MTLAVSMWSYVAAWRSEGLTIGGFIRAAKEAGADAVELLDFFYRDPLNPWQPSATSDSIARGREEAKAALAKTGLAVPIFSVANDFAKPSADDRQTELEKIRFGLEEAAFYGAGVVRVFAGDVKEGVSFDEARAWIVEGLAAASREANDRGLKLALENHGSLAGRGEQVRDLIEDVRQAAGNDALGANPDTGNFLTVDADPAASVAILAAYAKMVHLKDFARVAPEEKTYQSISGVPLAGRAIGEGEVDLAACVAALRAGGFNGVLSIEYEGAEPAATAMPRSILAAKRVLAG